MSIFEKFQAQEAQIRLTPEQQNDVASIQANPAAFLNARGYNIPDGMNDPRQITQYLLQNGQIGIPRLQEVMRQIGFPGRR